MKRHHLLLLTALVLLSLFSLYFIEKNKTASSSADKSTKILPQFDPNAVAQITLRLKEDTTTLELQKEGWKVAEKHNFHADYDKIDRLLTQLWQLKAVHTTQSTSTQWERLQLDKKNGTQITLKNTKGDATTLILGKPITSGNIPTGRFLRNTQEPNHIYSINETFPALQTTPHDWILKTLPKIENLLSITFTAPHDKTFASWTLQRTDPKQALQLKDPQKNETLDPAQAEALSRLFAYATLDDILSPEDPRINKAKKQKSQQRRLTLTTQDGTAYQYTLYPFHPFIESEETNAEKKYLAQLNITHPENKKPKQQNRLQDWHLLLPQWTLQPTLKTRAALLLKSKAPKEKTKD